MKRLFFTILTLLVVASAVTYLSRGDRRPPRPVVTWKTGICPERYAQVEKFREWMIRNGHVDADGLPLFDIQLEAESTQSTMIQAVSGMGSDLLDRIPVGRFAPMGVLEDITDFARENQMSPESGYPGAAGLLTWDGRQYGYPCNLAVYSLWINLDLLEANNVPAPPEEWTPEEFEQLGRIFTENANRGLPQQRYFFCSYNSFIPQIARSRGMDVFNETMTAATVANRVFADAIRLQQKWVEVDHLMPNAAERASEHAEFSHGGSGVSMFLYERYAMIATGRYVCMNLREAGKTFRLANVLFPQYSFKNALITARVSSVYAGSRYKKEAELFLSFLASEEYNQLLIDGADGLPPNPQIARRSTEFLTPARYPHEGTTHQNELKWAETIALPDPCSPYFPLEKTGIDAALDKVLNRLCSVEAALAETEERINRTIQEIADSTPDMRRRFQADLARQREIDRCKLNGEKIPSSLITNPFYIHYYRERGVLDETR